MVYRLELVLNNQHLSRLEQDKKHVLSKLNQSLLSRPDQHLQPSSMYKVPLE